MPIFPLFHRLRCAALMGLSGGAVAQTMTLWGGQLSQFLPPMPVMSLAGALGAGLAGLVLADGFGRAGWWGMFWSGAAWVGATALGACLGAGVFALELGTHMLSQISGAIGSASSLGLLAVADGILTSPAVASVWVMGGCAMHCGARAERAARPTSGLT